jgi:hypothetical protein
MMLLMNAIFEHIWSMYAVVDECNIYYLPHLSFIFHTFHLSSIFSIYVVSKCKQNLGQK